MKMFITGITGFVGSSVANYFSNNGYDVTGIGRRKELPMHVLNCKYIQADICKPLDEIDADVVIHAAALASDTAPFKELYNANVEGTKNILNAAKHAKHFVYISSSSVYHFHQHRMKETEAGLDFEKLSNYGKTKFLSEQLIINNTNKNKKTILRPRAIYGKHDQQLLPRLLKLVKGDKLIILQHLSKKISLTHIQNLILAIDLCIKKQSTALEIFNVADKEIYDLRHILTTLLPLVAGRPLKTVIIPAPIFNLFVAINNKIKFNPSFNKFAASSLTNIAVLNIDEMVQKMNYDPLKNFDNSFTEITDWVHKEDGWKNFLKPGKYSKPIQ
jgi:nucleoside-diphosphate-sugar epimerase